jgi:hypothetical protein
MSNSDKSAMFGISGEPKRLSRCTVLESLKWLTPKNCFSCAEPLYAFEPPRHGPRAGPSLRVDRVGDQ